MNTKSFNLYEVLTAFARHKNMIILITLLVAIVAVIYSLLTPKIWSSSATFYAVRDNTADLTTSVENLSSLASSFLGTGTSSNSMNYISVMKSRTFSEDIIRKFKLVDYFRITESDTTKAMDIALLKLGKKVSSIWMDDQTGLIYIRIQTKSKQLSREIADIYLKKLEYYNQNLKLTNGKRNRQFLETRVAEIRAAIDSLTVDLKEFQTKNKAIDLETQMTAIVTLYSDVISQQMQNDIQLQMARINFSSTSPLVHELEQKNKIMQDKIKDLEKNNTGLQPKYMLDIDKIPDLSMQYAQLLIDLEIQKKVFEFVYPQFELARLEEMKQTPTLEIVDQPREAGLRSKPRRALICITATLIGFIFSLLLALYLEYAARNKDKMLLLKQALWGRHPQLDD